jgi:hypothetical protein
MAIEARGRDADDRALDLARTQGAADDVRIRLKPPSPEAVADHGGAAGASGRPRKLVVALAQQAAARRLQAEHREILAGHEARPDVGGSGRTAPRHLEIRIAARREDPREPLLVSAQLFERRIEEDPTFPATFRLKDHQLLRVGDRQRPKHDRVPHAEGGGGGADA